MPKYYDGARLLSMSDINGDKPEIYIVTSNRTAGKTTFFGRYFVRRFIKYGEKFCLLFRFVYELDDIADKFFKDIGSLFFPGYSMRSEKKAKGIFHVLYLITPEIGTDGKPIEKQCGYAIAMNSADQIKKYSHYFSDVSRVLFDEFQSETNHYCSNEISKFQAIHTSIARGQGKQTRYVPVFMLSNTVSIINPYYVALGIANRLTPETHFLRGPGFVLEQAYNPDASNALKQSAFMKAFSADKYASYSADGKYLNDNNAFIERMPENGLYRMTIKYAGKDYSIKEYLKEGFLYVSDSVDPSYPTRITIDVEDHDKNYLLLSYHDDEIQRYKELFNHGCVRFKNQLCRSAFLALVSYKTV